MNTREVKNETKTIIRTNNSYHGHIERIGLTTARLARCRRFDYAGRRQRQQ